jgi:hypothetical protein
MNPTADKKVERVARLAWIPLNLVDFNPLAQRDLVQARVAKLVSEFDPEQLGYPTVNHRANKYWVIDGHHRIEALKQWLGDGWDEQHVQCQTYDGLSEDEEAEIFLKLNDVLAVQAFARFRIGVQAGRHEEVEVERIVRECMLRVSQDKGDGAISATGTLMRVYRRGGPQNLARTLLIVRDAYGDLGLEAVVLDGIGLLCHRYNGDVDDAQLVERLSKAHGGVNALLGKAEVFRKQTGRPKGHCVAAAAVEIHNGRRGGKKLPQWWRDDGDE